ncbi:MAG: SdpI family protein [Cyclobacteriaceae bacterium]
MSLESKIIAILIAVGFLNLILRKNRNWIFGYRSPRAIKTHASFAHANRIYGWGMLIAGVAGFVFTKFFERLYEGMTDWSKVAWLVGYFALLFIVIEWRLSRTTHED